MMMTRSTESWAFVDDQATFRLENPQHTSYLYFPLVNEAGMMSAVAPDLQGDAKTGQNTFLLPPVSVEDLHQSRAGRNFWIMMPERAPWSCTGQSAAQIAARHTDAADRVTLEAGLLWHTVTRENTAVGLRATITSLVPADTADTVELMRVAVTNTGDQPLTFTAAAAIPIYGRSADSLRDHRHVTSLLHRTRTERFGVVVQPALSFDERGHLPNSVSYAVLGVAADGAAPEAFCPVVEDFTGEGGTLDWPDWVMRPDQPGVPAGHTVDGYESIGALRFPSVTLAPGAAVTYFLVLGILDGDATPEDWIATYGSAAQFDAALAACRAYWTDKATRVQVHSGDSDFDRWMQWVMIQPVLRRLFGNSFLPYHDYGRGGRGWRDLWQDCLALLLTEPEDVPDLLYSSFAGVRFDGSNATIIGSAPGEFLADRNNIPRVWMDHGAWPLLTTRLYIDQSGDLDFLLRPQSYFKDPQIRRCQARDAQWTPEQGTWQRTAAGAIYEGSLLEHMLIQHLTAFFHVGEHNMILLEGADWNDGMDMARQRGESVAFSALYASNLHDLGDLLLALRARGVETVALAEELVTLLDTLFEPVDYDDIAVRRQRLDAYFDRCTHTISGQQVTLDTAELARDLQAKADWLTRRIRAQEWITNDEGHGWFNGYYDDDGQRVEGDHASGVRMTLTGQVFTLMGGIANEEQTDAMIRAADRYLWEPAMGGYRLNTDFGAPQLNLGRCFGFAFGHKENGAMFSHMAVMYANALYRRGRIQAGHRLLAQLYRQCRDYAASRMYPGIPEYFSARGRGMYPYLTGSASWLLLTLVMEVYGVRGHLGDLVLAPRLVAEQFDQAGHAGLTFLFAGKRLQVQFHNPARLDVERAVIGSVALNGAAVEGLAAGGREVRLPRALIADLDDAGVHQLVVTLVDGGAA
jgi:cellobiose phosphorylase